MHHSIPFPALVVLAALVSVTGCRKPAGAPAPPTVEKIPHVTTVHGVTLTDDYHWLRDQENPKIRAHLKAENAWADGRLAPLKPLRDSLLAEMIARAPESEATPPSRFGSWQYFTTSVAGKDFNVHLRKPWPDGADSIILDLNERAAGNPGYTFGSGTPSPDGNLYAWKENTDGSDLFTIRVKNLATGAILSDEIPNSAFPDSVVWTADGTAFFHLVADDALRSCRLKLHRLGTPPESDILIHEENDTRFSLTIQPTKSRRFLLITAASADMMETVTIPLSNPTEKPAVFFPRRENFRYSIADHDDRWFVLTNDRAINGRVIRIPLDAASPEKEILPADESISYGWIESFATHIVLGARKNGVPGIVILDPATDTTRWITAPSPGAWFSPFATPEFDSSFQRVSYETFLDPHTVADVDLASGKVTPIWQSAIPASLDRGKYRVLRTDATAPDGVKIPVWLLLPKDRPAGLLLNAYGAYGDCYDPWYDSNVFSLLDRGIGIAIAQVRGGGELGRRWYEAGKHTTKPNTFTDYIACAEHVIAEGHATKETLCGFGSSAGGLVAGVVINRRPDLFRAFIADVPFVDPLNSMLDPSLPLTTTEYPEWGNPTDSKSDFDLIRSYAPYENISRSDFPAILALSAWNDTRVPYWQPARWVAKLRAHQTGDNDIFFVTDLDTGHGGSSGRYTFREKIALQYAFIIRSLDAAE